MKLPDNLSELTEEQYKVLKKTIDRLIAESYFICGESGQKDKNGLPNKILVCPSYGADWFAIYSKDT